MVRGRGEVKRGIISLGFRSLGQCVRFSAGAIKVSA